MKWGGATLGVFETQIESLLAWILVGTIISARDLLNLRFPRRRQAVNAYSWPHGRRCGDRCVLATALLARQRLLRRSARPIL